MMLADDTLATLTARSRRFGHRTAILCGDARLSYIELDDRVARLASHLAERGTGTGSVVSISGPVGWEWAVAYHAVLRTGATVNPVNALLSADEVGFIVRDCGATLLIADAQRIDSVAASLPGTVARLSFETLQALTGKGAMLPAPEGLSPDDISTICYTSGTTGRPKGAMLSHRNVLLNAGLTAMMHGRQPGEVAVSALPLAHVYGNVVMNGTLIVGGTLVLLPRFDAASAVAAIRDHGAHRFDGVPTMYYRMLEELERDERPLPSLRLCTVGGQTMPVSQMAAVEQRLGCPLIELWGMSEIGGLGTTFPWTGPRTLGSIGIALPTMEARAVDLESRVPVGVGETGELEVRGPLVMTGYHGNDAATREIVSDDGWLSTGDVVRIDESGQIFVVDRVKDVILTSGNNVYPAEIERVIASLPGVVMVGVGRDAHPDKGEVAHGYLVLASGASVSADTVMAHCRTHLAPYKVPRAISFVDDLPKTASGKIMRRLLGQAAPADAPHNMIAEGR